MKLKATHIVLYLLISWSWSAPVNAQHIISEVTIEGNKKTKTDYLKRFINAEPGKPITLSGLNADLQTLKNMSSIQNATYIIDTTTDHSLKIKVTVDEVRTLLPVVNFGGIKDNFWYTIGFTDINWNGRGKQLLAYYQSVDGRHGGEVFFKNQYIKGSQWGYSASLLKYASDEPLYFNEGPVQYKYDLFSLSASLIKNVRFNEYFEFGLSAFREKYEQGLNQVLENPPGPKQITENKLLGKLRYQKNKLDYHYFYQKKYDWWAQVQTVYNFRDGLWFHTFALTYKRFWRVGKTGNLASRFRFGLSTNRDTPFAPFVADSFTNLRGIGNRIDRGTAQAILNIEYRQTIFDKNRWAGQFVAFTDIGTWRNPGGAFKQLVDPDQFRQFVGGGARLIYKKIYGAVLRVDFGIDLYNTRQQGLIIGFGQYF